MDRSRYLIPEAWAARHLLYDWTRLDRNSSIRYYDNVIRRDGNLRKVFRYK